MGRLSDPDIPLEPIRNGDGDNPPHYNDVADASWKFPPYKPIPNSWRETCENREDAIDRLSGISVFSKPLSEDPEALYHFVLEQVKVPPRLYVDVKGSVQQDKSWKGEFHFQLDLTNTLLRPVGDNGGWWYEDRICTKEETQLKRTGPGNLNSEQRNGEAEDASLLGDQLESASSNDSQVLLMQWCEEFCKTRKGPKSFTIAKELQGVDKTLLRRELKSYVQSIKFDGRVELDLRVEERFVTVYSPHLMTRLWKNRFIWWVCVLAQLWIIFAPVIGIIYKGYEVVSCTWKASREVPDSMDPTGLRKMYARGRDEEKIADLWGPIMVSAANERRSEGEILTERDMESIQRRAQERLGALRSYQLDNSETSALTMEDS